MGMTIDEHIEVLKSYHHGFTGCACNLQDSIDVAVDIMQKYQKIEEEISQWHKDGTNWSDLRLMAIERILENGSNNQHN